MRYFVVDAFCRRAFAGNPAAICLPEHSPDEAEMQSLAAEFNLSETAFLLPHASPDQASLSGHIDRQGDIRPGDWQLRWFTPQTEVRLCGHATLAAAQVLWQELGLAQERLRFHTLSGVLDARRDGSEISLDFPRQHTRQVMLDDSLKAIAPAAVSALTAGDDMIVVLADAAAVAAFQPDLSRIASLPLRGLMVTAAGVDCDFVSRFFAPAVGIDEDPVTGSAHCALADYWGQRLAKTRLSARQLSARGGELTVVLQDQRVLLQGQAVTVMAGQIRLD